MEAEGLIQNKMKKCLQGFEGKAGTEYAGKTGLLGQEQLRGGSAAKPIKPSLASHGNLGVQRSGWLQPRDLKLLPGGGDTTTRL